MTVQGAEGGVMCTFPHVIKPDAVWKQIISFTLHFRYNGSKQYDDNHSRCGIFVREKNP
jgi:hypothetical protein